MLDIDFEVLEKLCKFHQSKILGLNPERINLVLEDNKNGKKKYKEFKTDGYYVNLIDHVYYENYSTVHRRYLGLTKKPLNEGGVVFFSIEKADSDDGIINDKFIILNGKNPIKYKNLGTKLSVNKYLTKEKFFENAIMSDIALDYEYFELAMRMKRDFQDLNKKIQFRFNEIDPEIFKRTIVCS